MSDIPDSHLEGRHDTTREVMPPSPVFLSALLAVK